MSLTNEDLRGKFINNFDLVNFAISVARNQRIEERFLNLAEVMDELKKLPQLEKNKK